MGLRGSSSKDRGQQIGVGLRWTSIWALRIVIIAAGAWVVGSVLGKFWDVVLPVVLALLITAVLWPVAAFLRKHGWPPALAAAAVLLGGILVVVGAIAFIVPSIIAQSPQLATQTGAGLTKVQKWLEGPPFRVSQADISSAISALTSRLQSSASSIAPGVCAGVTSALSSVVGLATAVFLVFFFLKDGPRFLPWMERSVGERAGKPLTEVLLRTWRVLGSFIRPQAVVSLVDATFIGAGLLILGVPLAFPLIVLTFFGGFIPIVGAFVAGAIAVLGALVAKGLSTALIVLIIIIVVQQLEGNVLQPVLQSRSMNLHAAVVLLAVTAGASLYGITGAFLAVPVVSVVSEIWRFRVEQMDARAREEQLDLPESDRAQAGPPASDVSGGRPISGTPDGVSG